MSAKPDLSRFTCAQQSHYQQALSEIRTGRKHTHWMWFIFPQLQGLGYSATSQYYAIRSLDEARAFLQDPYLGGNLREICQALLDLSSHDPLEVFGRPDDRKLCSSMTLFACADPQCELFEQVIAKYFGGRKDGRTLRMLGR